MAKFDKRRQKDFIPHNYYIQAEQVILIDSEGKNLGTMLFKEAFAHAEKASLDLIQISSGNNNIPICKIAEYGKYRYEFSKKRKENDKKKREAIVKVKEIEFRPSTDEHDLKVKAAKAIEFLNDGDRVKIGILFKGRELSHQEIGRERLKQFLSFIPSYKTGSDIVMNGKLMTLVILPEKQIEK